SLIELPHGKTVLIDGGGLWGSFDIGERVVGPALWRKRIRTIDVLILSHSDFDHSGGLAFILKHFNVGQIWLSQWQAPTRIFYTTLALAEEHHVPCYLLSAEHSSLYVGETHFEFLNPQNSFLNERTNNLSLVFKMTYKNFSILFTGDIEKEIEQELLLKDIHATILKVPHHGSKTSSSYEFLKKVSPSLAVMSLGYQNRHHFPHGQVLKRYENLKIPTWRTDEQGTLQIQTDGKNVWH
ncbi:MAG: MBL fold metallo-hydrolase, partial [Deltaproteobacteria bacterium]|nr:MBL fold metallo-hydrolase [Deltaproteobacteria bacterium]